MEERTYIVTPSIISDCFDATVYKHTPDGEKKEVIFYACSSKETAERLAKNYIKRR